MSAQGYMRATKPGASFARPGAASFLAVCFFLAAPEGRLGARAWALRGVD